LNPSRQFSITACCIMGLIPQAATIGDKICLLRH
jgi:hypothetical protein